MKKLLVSLSAVLATSAAIAGYDTPDATMDALREALAAGKLPQLSAFLPASYQSDITGLVQSFAGKMDPDLWNAARNAAMNTRFNTDAGAPALQEGTITYKFILK